MGESLGLDELAYLERKVKHFPFKKCYKGKRMTVNPYGKQGEVRYSVIVWDKNKRVLHVKHGFKSEGKAEEYKDKLRCR